MEVLSLKEQYEQFDLTLKDRLDNLLPKLMKETNVSMWVVICEEYNEDPVFFSLVPGKVDTASHPTILVYELMENDKVKRVSIGGHRDFGDMYPVIVWNPDGKSKFELLKEYILEENPTNVALNYSKQNQFADGLTKGLYDKYAEVMPDEVMNKTISAEPLVVRWLETKTPKELLRYQAVCNLAKEIIDEAFSSKVITPGVTTTDDVEWHIMERIKKFGLGCWFNPTIDVQRGKFLEGRNRHEIILPGDILHCDVGIKYMQLCTDTQRIVYVPKEGETKVPDEYLEAFKIGLRWQKIVALNCIKGRTGDEILLASYKMAKEEGIEAQLYSHPIGYHGHGCGPAFGLFYKKGAIGGHGLYKLNYDTCYALELNCKVPIKSWNNQKFHVFMEETVCFQKDGELCYLMPGYDEFKLVR